ncbi:gliding motility-associated C-terminal domain-containing protein [Chryseobacterium sp. MP_3.2]|uniref:T9SS type B sorting domain-containing protein n=1 Tax=Chryseobacterium sp. MP_3.2 TaxID=3071712 RepID=UPI002E08707C|nr:gliding motility-associated-like protein [Chryseobacterium sp. MP_3.2]
MKKILLILFLLFSFTSYAQLDREHWFAPMVDRVNNTNTYQSIYMSTNEAVPFAVEVYFNNAIVGTVTISKNNPVKYSIPSAQRGRIITTNQSDLFRPIAMGFYLKGARPFFASLRFSITNHGEIQTSKGTAALGTEFRAVMAPITVTNGILNFMNSVMATEDNTSVTISEFGAGVSFSDFTPRTQITFTLNKGQSYIVDGRGNNTANFTAYIGAKIVSDKPVVIANGNFNGQYAGSFSNSSDILMDQGVPIDKLGQEFVLMKGNGNQTLNMEKGLILATENNTEIYINDGTAPVVTLNAGQYYLTTNTAYIGQGAGHFNMFIRATKNVYVYQLLAGANSSTGTEEATGGFNYIPPLNCYLPKKIDEIGRIDENEYTSNGVSYSLTVPTKLNIITERGAVVNVVRNGIPLPLNVNNGPFDVLGNTNWVTYNVSNITGNIAVFSSNAVTAGISAGNDAVGYGGYFAGFSSIPLILKTDGDCLPGVKLEVTAGFDSYEWLLKVGATYVPAPGINNTFEYSPTQAGIYAVKVKQGSCPEIQTKDFKFYNCTTFTNYNYNTCSTQDITPVFALSTQTVNIPTIKIDTPPSKGTATVAADGTIKYTAFPNATGTDTFKFSFCGNDPSIPDCETVQATINLNQIVKYDVVLNSCSATSTATYDLTSAAITPDITVIKKYFSDTGYTNQIPVAQLANYVSAPGFVYVQMSNTFGCSTTATIELKIKVPPIVNPALYTLTHCDEEIDGIIDGNYKVDLTTITPTIIQNPTNFTTRYFPTQAKAISGLPSDAFTGNFVFTGDTSVWIRVDSPDTCPPVIKEVILKIGANATLITLIASKDVCDLLENNSENINLADYIPLFSTATGTTATYFDTLIAAQNNTPTISAAQTITVNKTFYYRLNVPGFCNEIGTLNIILSKGTPSAMLPLTITICEGSTTTLNVGAGYTNVLWSNGATSTTINVGVGNYFVDLTNASGCVYRQNVSVVDSPKPILNIAAYNATNCDDNFDGIMEINLLNVTPAILPNAALFTVRYYSSQAFANAGGNNNLPNNFSYTTDTIIYVRVDSPVCSFITGMINFKFGPNLSLIASVANQTVCDDDISGSENISLATYRNLFSADAAATVQYFTTLANAQNNIPTISATQTINGDQTFYYRFTKAGYCDIIGTLNISFKASTPSALLDSYTVCIGTSTKLDAGSAYTAFLWKKGTTTVSTSQTATLNAGIYTVSFTNSSGCVFTKDITILEAPKPNWTIAAYNPIICDDNFDGIITVNLTNVTPVILPNFAGFKVQYFRDSAFQNEITDLANFTYNASTTIYVRATSAYCPVEFKTIDFKIGNKLTLIAPTENAAVCDDDFDGIKIVDLAVYKSLFTTDTAVSVTYFTTLTEAQNGSNPIASSVTIFNVGTYYLRFKKANICDVIGTLNLTIKIPKKSTTLNTISICPEGTVILDAGVGFDQYLWSTGETTSNIQVSVGEYYVDLSFDGCSYRQNISVSAVELPMINSVDIKGSTVTVNASGGNPPLQYSIDYGPYQTSNLFLNVLNGDHLISVISADNCTAVTTEINVIQIFNAITPNNDGFNDKLDYSGLLTKEEAFLEIFDRYGKKVFTGAQNNRYTWDGSAFGRIVSTGTYWYVIKWKENGAETITQYSGWVLVKNRE